MEIELPYSVEAFNGLTSLQDARKQFLTHNGPNVILSSIWDIFYKHKVTEQFGPTLLHRHFGLEHDKAVVDVNGTSTPWTLQHADNPGVFEFKKYGGFIKPCAWMILNGRLMPFEFYFEHSDDSDGRGVDIKHDFVKDFVSALEAHGMTSVIGLRLVRDPERQSIEVTEGMANVTFPFTNGANALVEKEGTTYLETGWKYPADRPDDNVDNRKLVARAICWWKCVIERGTHVAIHVKG